MEIERFIAELGTEGRLVSMQLEELMFNVEDEGRLVIRDYMEIDDGEDEGKFVGAVPHVVLEDLLDLNLIARRLGYDTGSSNLDTRCDAPGLPHSPQNSPARRCRL